MLCCGPSTLFYLLSCRCELPRRILFKAVSFAKSFDCAKCFTHHQVEWSSEDKESDVVDVGQSLEVGNIQRMCRAMSAPDARAFRVSFVRQAPLNKSLSMRTGIPCERTKYSTQVGLRGDSVLYKELKEYVRRKRLVAKTIFKPHDDNNITRDCLQYASIITLHQSISLLSSRLGLQHHFLFSSHTMSSNVLTFSLPFVLQC